MTDDATPETPTDIPRTRRPRWLSNERAGFVALGVAVVALGATILPYVGGADFGGRVRTYLVANPQVLDEVLAAREARARVEQVAQARTLATQVSARIAANPTLLAIDPRDPTFGPDDAKVTVIEFFDFRCPGCKATAPDYLRIVRDNPDVRFIFKDWPILDRGPDVTSQYAARAALAAHQQGKYLVVFEDLMAQPSLTHEAIDRILVENGVSVTASTAAIASPATTRHIADIHTTAAALGINGTPTFIVNGVASATIEPADIAARIAAAKRS